MHLLDDVSSVSDVGTGDWDSANFWPRGVHRHLSAASSTAVCGRALELKSVPEEGPVFVGSDHNLLFFGRKGHSFWETKKRKPHESWDEEPHKWSCITYPPTVLAQLVKIEIEGSLNHAGCRTLVKRKCFNSLTQQKVLRHFAFLHTFRQKQAWKIIF